jgi:hypothetical protein
MVKVMEFHIVQQNVYFSLYLIQLDMYVHHLKCEYI